MEHLNKFKIKVSFLVALTLLSSFAFAGKNFYDERPQILKTQAQNHTSVKEWNDASRGHLFFLAQTLTFFPKSDYYFLARDIEYLYDIAQLMAKDDPVLKERIHLVPVSTALSQEEKNMIEYLEQEGLKKERLKGRSALFIDSCCAGSVPDRIKKAFSNRGVDVRGFLIQTDEYPNSKVAEMAGANGLNIEELPHYNDSAEEYVKDNGKIRIRMGETSSHEIKNSVKIMQKIRFEYDNAKARKEFKEIVGLMRLAYSYFAKESSYKRATKAQAFYALETLTKKYDVSISAFLSDIEALKRKKYAELDIARLKEFKNSSSKIFVAERESAIQKILLNPDLFDETKEKLEYLMNDKEVLLSAIRLLLETTPAQLGTTEKTYKMVMASWLEKYEYEVGSPEDVTSMRLLFKGYLITEGAAGALWKMVDAIHSYYDNPTIEKDKFTAEMFVEALSKDKYSYGKNSALRYLMNDFNGWVKNKETFTRVMTNVIENTSDEVLSKVMVDFIQNMANWSYDDVQLKKFSPELVKILKLAVDSLPTISKPLIAAYLESILQNYSDNSSFKDFAKWLFAQRDYFEAEALKMQIDPWSIHSVPGAKSLKEIQSPRVEHLVDLYSPIPALPPFPLTGLRGKQCSQSYRTK